MLFRSTAEEVGVGQLTPVAGGGGVIERDDDLAVSGIDGKEELLGSLGTGRSATRKVTGSAPNSRGFPCSRDTDDGEITIITE